MSHTPEMDELRAMLQEYVDLGPEGFFTERGGFFTGRVRMTEAGVREFLAIMEERDPSPKADLEG